MHIGRVGSVLATSAVTIDRFVAVVYPLKKFKKTRFILSVCLIGSILYNIPRFLEFETIYIYLDENEKIISKPINVTHHEKNITKVNTRMKWQKVISS